MTKDDVNALPDKVRKYIHDLEARCDPAGDTQRIASLTEQVGGLTAKVKGLKSDVRKCDEHECDNPMTWGTCYDHHPR